MKKRLISILAVLCAVVSLALFAGGCGESYEQIPDFGYEARAMKVTATVNKDLSVDIVEELTIHYTEASHGFIRTLPTNSGERYENILVDGDRARFSHEYGDFVTIRIGDEDRLLFNTDKQYTIGYTVHLPHADGDTLIYNFVGTDFDMVREGVAVVVSYPEALVAAPEVSVGKLGETGSGRANAVLSEDGKSVTVTLRSGGSLAPFEGITLSATLPDGTLNKPFDYSALIMWIVGIVAVAAALLLYILKCRQPDPLPVVNFYPPMGANGKRLSPVEVGLLIDNSCSNSDVTSLIFYWASNGCLDIEEKDGETCFIYKKELPAEAPAYEKKMFRALFAKAKEKDGETKVELSSLKDKFYSEIARTKSAVGVSYMGKLYEKSNAAFASAFGVIAVILAIVAVFYGYMRIAFGWLNFIGAVAAIPVVVLTLIGLYLKHNKYKLRKSSKIGIAICFVLLAAAFSAALTLVLPSDVLSVAEKAAVGVTCALLALISPFMRKRTKFYNDVLGELVGFKDFLTLAEKDKLEKLLKDDPQYYYNILPYANVLGVSKVWQDKFEQLTVEPPTYYRMSTGDVFTVIVFNRVYNTANNRCRDVLVSRPNNSGSSGGGFSGSGGGFSGGGFGGGGSRRW